MEDPNELKNQEEVVNRPKKEVKGEKEQDGITFRKFNQIENSEQEQMISKIYSDKSYWQAEWVSLEKVHGANFSYVVDATGSIKCAKRTGFLAEDEIFYNCRDLMELQKEKIKKVWKIICDSYEGEVLTISIFGELFGGSYPHPEVPKIADVKHVQKGVYYSPKIDFYGYDISVNRKGYLGFDETSKIFEEAGFFHAKALQRGKLEELLKFDVETFETTLPQLLGYPSIENNFAEGIVIKTVETKYLPNQKRCILKKKRSSFSEVKPRPLKPPKPVLKMEGELEILLEDLLRYVTENRLRAVISKIGEIDEKMKMKLIGQFSADALADFKKDFPAFSTKKTEEKKMITKRLNEATKELVNCNLEAIIEGNF